MNKKTQKEIFTFNNRIADDITLKGEFFFKKYGEVYSLG
jgi:hypothetical protein